MKSLTTHSRIAPAARLEGVDSGGGGYHIYICIYIRMLYTYIEQAQRVQRTYIVECRVSKLGITITLWGKYPP